ncbi:hypothetical protein OR16_30704 [Cupriavidus basilensis OR16]|uniref:Uncharacterized protein n=1 Tax=Cupriavidus basilensis OR16 TaxID=1127483 RepID=H1SD21_9BURK|nr:DUF6348 family protein [Cupriavidus basilensis]EHP39567.1 hypothetical protein OR16_30704 [Cupriavidus basilensis OR16]
MTSESTYTPQINPGNPGETSVFSIAFTRDDKSWTEDIDLTSLLQDVLMAESQPASRHGAWLQTAEGLWLLPQLLSWHLREDGTGQSSTTIQACHEGLVPEGCFEFQHAASDVDAATAMRNGFTQWARTDAVALRESARAEVTECMSMTMDFPGKAGHPALRRRVVLGPASHYMATPQAQAACPAAASAESVQDSESDEHGFCPCCLLTKSMDAFRPLLESTGYAAIRLYAARDGDGEIQADCRLNGEDYPPGQVALMDYVKTWPEMGFEFRKQLVVVHSLD